MTRAKNGTLLKTALCIAGLGLTVVLTLLASGRTAGRESQKIIGLQERDLTQDARLAGHDDKISDVKVEISALKANQQQILTAQREMSGKLDTIILRLPAVVP